MIMNNLKPWLKIIQTTNKCNYCKIINFLNKFNYIANKVKFNTCAL